MKIKQLVEYFKQQKVSEEGFGHINHLKVAWFYVFNYPIVEAKEQFHKNIIALTKELGAEEKYHTTVTDFFLDYLLHLKYYLGPSELEEGWLQIENFCPLLIKDAKHLIGFYYSKELIESLEAKNNFIEADIVQLDRASLKLSTEDVAVFHCQEQDSPLIVSMPHNGQFIPHSVLQSMNPTALDSADTDWYMSQLYRFLDEMKISTISANYSRYLIDLNRDISGQELYQGADNTELCPTSTFEREALYKPENKPKEEEIQKRATGYWKPYHQKLSALIAKAKAKHGYAIVFDAHSIQSHVPRFFEGQLPDFNFGTNQGATVNQELAKLLESFDVENYSKVINGRFKGGFITRQYAQPDKQVFTVQLELSQATHLDEDKRLINPHKAQQVSKILQRLITEISQYSPV